MEQVHGKQKISKFEPPDFISAMPENATTNILDRLPVRDAVKTAVLSKNWKFNWTLLTHLIFDEVFFDSLPEKFDGKIISRLLLHLKGPITKFVLHIPFRDKDILYLEDIITFLSSKGIKGIKEIIIACQNGDLPDLPTQVYACMELKHLELCFFSISSLRGFHGFPNLLSLHLFCVKFVNCTFGEFISRCPLLEILSNYELNDTRELELIEVSKLANLKKLSWSMCMDTVASGGDPDTIKSSSFYQLSALPKLQELNLDFGNVRFMEKAGADMVPAAFLCLETLTLSEVNFGCDDMSSFVLEMICNSPNLRNLNITGIYNHDVSLAEFSSLDLGCYAMKQLQLQLRSVSFSSFRGSKTEVCLVEFILASSPLLEKIVISVDQDFMEGRTDNAWSMAGKLLNFHRASPIVDISFVKSTGLPPV